MGVRANNLLPTLLESSKCATLLYLLLINQIYRRSIK